MLRGPLLEFAPALGGGIALGVWEAAAFFMLLLAVILSRIPLPLFQQAANWLQGQAGRMQGWSLGLMQQAVGTWTRIAGQSYVGGHNSININAQATEAQLQALENVQHRIIPHRAATAHGYSDSVRQDAYRRAGQLHGDALDATARARAQAIAHTDQAAQHLQQQISANESADTLRADRVLHLAQVHADQDLRVADRYADQIAERLQHLLDANESTDTLRAERVLQQSQAHADAVGRAGAAYTDRVGADLQSWARSQIAAQVAPVAATAATAAAAAEAVRELDCLKFCDPLASLGAGLEAIDLAAVLALMVAIARDPKGGPGLVQELVGPVLADVEAEARRLLGVKGA